MKYFLDISLVLLILVTVFSCWKKGFIRSVFGVAKIVVASVLTYMLGGYVSDKMAEYWLDEKITGYVSDKLFAMFDAGAQTFDLSKVFDHISDSARTMLEKLNVDVSALAEEYASHTTASSEELRILADRIAQPVSTVLSNILGYSVVFLVLMLSLSILGYLLGKATDLPVIHAFDRTLGLALGVVSALFYASVYTLLVFAVLNLISTSYPAIAFGRAYEETVLFKAMYETNLIRIFFGKG